MIGIENKINKDTWGALCPAHQIEAGSYYVGHLATSCQMLAHHHLEKVEGCVEAVLVQLQLAPQAVYLPFP